jgi:hypothetical protein
LVGCDAVLLETELLPDVDPVLGLRYAGGAERVTVVPPAGLTALPLEVLPEVLFTFVAVVLFVVVLLTEELLVALPVVGEDAAVDVLRLTLLLTPAPPLMVLLPPAASLSEPVWYLWPL